ncbi:MAG: hypothetical protein Q9184_000176 [Pyrenodesmia sp. 2 TL-2023]
MSHLPNGTNGYVNGDHGAHNASQYHPTYRDGGPVRAGRDQRPEAYGAFESGEGNLAAPRDNDGPVSTAIDERFSGITVGYDTSRHRSNSRNQVGWQHTGQDGDREGPQSASRTYGNGPGGRQIEGRHTLVVYRYSRLPNGKKKFDVFTQCLKRKLTNWIGL